MKKSIAVILILMIMVGLLTGCAEKPRNQSEKNGSIAATPTITPTNTPTATPTPTPIPHKTKQEVAEELKNVKVSVDDLMNEDVVYPTYFGAVDDNLTDEMIKRISYFDSFGVISYSDAKILVTYLNYCYLNSDAVDKDKAEQFLSLVNDHNLNILTTHIIKYILKYNYNHPDNQIVISWGAIDNALGKDGSAVLNNIQKDIVKTLTTNLSIEDIVKTLTTDLSIEDIVNKYLNNDNYNITITSKNKSKTNIAGLSDNLNIVVKFMETQIINGYSTIIVDNCLWDKVPSDEIIQYHFSKSNSIESAFSDPEHANVRRYGFDANAFYEEDLQ